MALLNGLYVHAVSETIENSYNKTNNPVEEGVDVTDHIERNLIKLQLQGELIDTSTLTAGKMYSQLQLWANKGTIIQFRGRNVFDGVITNISKKSTAEISNGAEVTIDFEEMRVANSLYTEPKANAGTQQVQSTKNTDKEVWHTVQKGEWLLKIARKYNTTLEWILAHNKLKSGNPNLIYPGEKILVSTNGVPNSATTSTNKNTVKTNKATNTSKTTNKASTNTTKQVVKAATSEEQSYVVAETSKKVDISKLTTSNEYGTMDKITMEKANVATYLVESLEDKIKRIRDYISWFNKKKGEFFAEWGDDVVNKAEYEKYLNWISYALNVMKKNLNQKQYISKAVKDNTSNCYSAIDNCDKAKINLEKSLQHQYTNRKSFAKKVVSYLKSASTVLHKDMNETIDYYR